MVVADAEESAKAEGGVRHAPARLLDHDALNLADLLVVGAIDSCPSTLSLPISVLVSLHASLTPDQIERWHVASHHVAWAAEQIAALVREAREVNENLRAYSLLNIVDAQGKDNDDAAGVGFRN